MNEKLTDALTSLIEVITTTSDFVLSQAPDVIQQLIHFSTVKYTIWLSICGFIWIILIAGITRMYQTEQNKTCGDHEAAIWTGLILGGVLSFITAAVSMPLLKIILAPKVWLIEYASQLL